MSDKVSAKCCSNGPTVSPLPAQAILAAFLAMCFLQFVGFGVGFSFVESTGAREVTAQVDNNEVLKGVKMHPDRAKWLEEISAYVNENDLQGKEVILYGYVPSLSYYLQMPSAFNPWSDLRSYHPDQMAAQLQSIMEAGEKPVVILNMENLVENLVVDTKRELLIEFMGQMNYKETFRNEKFVVYQ